MKKVSALALCLFFQITFTFASNIIELRKLYYQATEKRDSAVKFFKIMESLNVDSNPLLLCYKGMANLIQANFSNNPYNKLASFSKGKEMLEKSVKADPKSIEIRFMRFCVQTNAPPFFGYNKDINYDKAIILQGWNKIHDIDLKTRVKKYMLDSVHCTNEEKNIFK